MNDAFKKTGTSKGDRIKMFNSLFYQYLFINYWKCKYPMNPHVPLLLVGWSVDWMVGRYVIISFKVTELHFHAPIGALLQFVNAFFYLSIIINEYIISIIFGFQPVQKL